MTNCDPIEQLKDLVAAYGNPNDAEALDELASLRSQLSECQRELDAEKYMTEHVNMPRLRALQQQLQQMKEALNKVVALCAPGRNGRHRQLCKIFSEIVDIQAEALHPEQVAAARALLSGKE